MAREKINTMNFKEIVAHGHVLPGDTIKFVGKNKSINAIVLKDGRITCHNEIYERPSQIWRKFKVYSFDTRVFTTQCLNFYVLVIYSHQEHRKVSFWDRSFHKDVSLRHIRNLIRSNHRKSARLIYSEEEDSEPELPDLVDGSESDTDDEQDKDQEQRPLATATRSTNRRSKSSRRRYEYQRVVSDQLGDPRQSTICPPK